MRLVRQKPAQGAEWQSGVGTAVASASGLSQTARRADWKSVVPFLVLHRPIYWCIGRAEPLMCASHGRRLGGGGGTSSAMAGAWQSVAGGGVGAQGRPQWGTTPVAVAVAQPRSLPRPPAIP